MSNAELVCVGEPLFELSNVGPGKWNAGVGGDVSNVAVAAARQGTRSTILTQLGDDDFAAEIRNFWAAEGVNDAYAPTLAGAETGMYFITHDAGEHKFEYRRSGSAASQVRPEDLSEEAFGNAAIVHLSGISQAISPSARATTERAIAIAKKKGIRVSYDPNLRLKLWPLEEARKVILDTVRKVDIFLPGLDDARILTGMEEPVDIVRFFADLGAPIIALTMGGRGVLAANEGDMRFIPSPRVDAVDATGAGDCFDGAFLSQLINEHSVFDAATYAATAAAISVQGHGAAKSIPNREAVLALQEQCRGETWTAPEI